MIGLVLGIFVAPKMGRVKCVAVFAPNRNTLED
jgi:hypothetical protein